MARDHIPHYEITGKIGAGAMGEVYRPRDTKLDREVAITVLPEALIARNESRSRFRREAKLLLTKCYMVHCNTSHVFAEAQGHEDLALGGPGSGLRFRLATRQQRRRRGSS